MRIVLPLLLLVALLVLSFAMDPPRSRADLVTGYISIETLDPQVARAHEDIEVAYTLFEGLVTFDPKDFSMQPGVAERWDVSEDGLTYTFHLRPDAKWSNGDPVTAHDFRYAWKFGMTPDVAPPYIDFLLLIKGGKEYFDACQESLNAINEVRDGKTHDELMAMAKTRVEGFDKSFDELVGVQVVDDRTLRVTLREYLPYFTEIASTWPLFPLHPPTIERHVRVDPFTYRLRRDPQWTKPGTIVSNGPYELEEWAFKRQIRVRRNKHFHSADQVDLESIEFVNFQDMSTLFTAYESGELDLAVGVTPVPYAAELIEAKHNGDRDDVHEVDAFGTYYYEFNTREKVNGKPNPLADVRLRKALVMAIDKEPLVKDVTRLRQTTTTCFIPRGAINGYTPPEGLPYDVDAAKQLLAEAGYPNGEGLGTIDVRYNTGGGHENVAQAIARMWQENLGINVELNGEEWKVFLFNRNKGQFTIARAGWFGDYTDPTTFLDMFHSDNGHNDPGYDDPEYDALLARAGGERDAAKRFELLRQAEDRMLNVGVPIVPMYYYKIIHLFDPTELEGVSVHSRNLQLYWRMKRKGRATR